ncbi:2-polyprenyl-3-methyl-6-methoxy-1,4-benzoquinone monooxygenase [Acidihalobacter prosperus]|uniref:3-demethoxyubiquinol 3-hydroxylase n=1 Tax=Acidihalobacter prosperus TaxID=160660 RepID=A0A1A6C0I0_9GAMM|nr:2-polyprenyl-3-methyl-6-methoxy-1,4-benzoquinone monooxygenase [Acidihalobacter prosperus]OBS08067.1 2-octaprenyl-3-methyl-6-methoxy-1,4-benzoquinol hydroxylase [Acidihalobacter prosperus]
MRQLSPLDRFIGAIDQSLRTVYATPPTTGRPNPAAGLPEADLDEAGRRLAGRLLRVDHAGEVAAQGLYQGQAITARDAGIREQMQRSADEENDHLAWCESRLEALEAHKSYLNPFWYWGSFGIGALAGLAGDRWSLGFVDETEQQVVRHIDEHLQKLPQDDQRSRAVLAQMREDEAHHAYKARTAGAAKLPAPVRGMMRIVSKVMTTTAEGL